MDINEYKKEFLEDVRNEATIKQIDPEREFIEKTLSLLEEIGEVSDPVSLFFGKQGRKNKSMQFDAFAFDEADNSLILLISDFTNNYETDNLTVSKIDSLLGKMEEFIQESYDGVLKEYCDDASEVLKFGQMLDYRLHRLLMPGMIFKFKFYIITNSKLSNLAKTISKPDFLGRPVELNIWSIERFFDIAISTSERESITIKVRDFGFDGLPCLKAEMGVNSDYDAYLAIVPGKFLSDIYIKHGSRLLEGNVRAFLSNRGNVNKGIRRTILSEPTKFFTYNNGIATTAATVVFSNTEEGLKIEEMVDLQIINGGQTTASLASAKLRDKNNLENIYVPMKLTVIKNDDYNLMIQNIAHYANSQNKVTEADFFSNSPFHITIEKLSAKCLAPAVNGNQFSTVWFYERSRGKYEQEQMKLSEASRNAFKIRNPKQQIIKKEDLAKYINILDLKPHLVSRGNQKNLLAFAEVTEKAYQENKDQFNEFYFKKVVCGAIMYREIDKLVYQQPWYTVGGYKSDIVIYTLAKILFSIPKNKALNIQQIWNKQTLSKAFLREAEIVSKRTNQFIQDSKGVIVHEYCKSEECWKAYKEIPYDLTKEFLDELVDKEELVSQKVDAKKEAKIENELSVEIQVCNYGAPYWRRLIAEGKEKGVLTPPELSLLEMGASLDGARAKVPNTSQAKKILEIRDKLSYEGIKI